MHEATTNLADGVGVRATRAIGLAPRVLLVGFICYLSTEIGFAHKIPPSNISVLWPTGAILFSVLVVTPVRHWWAYILAAYFGSVINDARAGFPIPAILFLVAGIIEILIAAVGVRRFADGPRAFDSLRGLVVYILVAVVLSPFISAFGAAFAGGTEDYWFYWRAWFLSEALAYLMLAPAILTWIGAARTVPGNAPLGRFIEALLIGCGLLAISVFVFSPVAVEGSIPVLVYLPLPFLLWAAVRFGPVGVNTCILIVAFLSISGAVHGRGPFAANSPAESVLSLQLFLVSVSLPVMFLAVLLAERRARTILLRESEARFRIMANTAPVMLWMSGADKLCTFFNRGWLDFTGRMLEQELGNGWAEGVHREDFDRCLKIYTDSFDARRQFTMEYRLRRFDGEYRWVLDNGVPRSDPDGAFLGYIGTAIDITELKRSQENFRLAVEASPSAMVMVNQQGRIVMVNAQAEKMFGYAREELIGQSVEALVPDQYRIGHPAYRAEFFAAPQARPMGVGRELFGQRKNGSKVPVEIGLNPVHTPEGLFVMASIIDITERKQAERESAEQRNELAHLSRAAMLGELSGSLAHELNQPLAAILSNAQAAQRMLGRGTGNIDEFLEILKDIVEDDRRAGEVIKRLRALLRKDEAQHRVLDINEVVREVLKLMRSDLLNRNVAVSTDLATGLPRVVGDRVQLQQVLLNLSINGCDAMDGEPGDCRLTLRTAAAAGGEIEVSVVDRGRGIPPEHLERIFEPFVSTKAEGLGMGLTICRTIVAAHHGRLWAANNADRGARFCFTLPAKNEQPHERPEADRLSG